MSTIKWNIMFESYAVTYCVGAVDRRSCVGTRSTFSTQHEPKSMTDWPIQHILGIFQQTNDPDNIIWTGAQYECKNYKLNEPGPPPSVLSLRHRSVSMELKSSTSIKVGQMRVFNNLVTLFTINSRYVVDYYISALWRQEMCFIIKQAGIKNWILLMSDS